MSENKIFDPKPEINKDYVGNIRASRKSEEYTQLWTFLRTYFDKYIITFEAIDTDKEHCHFWAQGCKLKDNDNQRSTLANYFRRDLPSLKRDGKGGSNKYNLKKMNEIFQFYYIFKEYKEIKYTCHYAVNIDDKLCKEYIEHYKTLLKAKNTGKAGLFTQHCIDKFGPTSHLLKSRSILIETYMDWTLELGTAPTINLCDRYVNHVLNQYDHKRLTEQFKNIINDKYNKAYFT